MLVQIDPNSDLCTEAHDVQECLLQIAEELDPNKKEPRFICVVTEPGTPIDHLELQLKAGRNLSKQIK